jgi:hypothetical protein
MTLRSFPAASSGRFKQRVDFRPTIRSFADDEERSETMAEHLHGYPHCETPAGQSCPPTDVHYAECQAHGPLESCTPSIVDGVPTSQYHCVHRDADTATPARPKAKPKPKPKTKPKPKKKAAAKAKGKPKKAARKPAKKAKGKAGKKAGKKKKK